MKISRRSVAIVGGGIFGASAALAFADGGWDVVVLDPGPLPHPRATSTDISKVVRASYGDDVWSTELAESALPGWRAWNRRFEAAGLAPIFEETGLLLLTEDALSPESYEATSRETLAALGHPVETLDEAALRARFPAWARGRAGTVDPQAGWVRASAVVEGLLHLAREAGAEIRSGVGVSRVIPDGGLTMLHTTEDDALVADCHVLTTGAWTASLLPELEGLLHPVAQPVFHLAPEDPSLFRPPHFLPFGADITRTGWYGFPANEGGLVKLAHHGPGREVDPSAPRETTAEDEAALRAFLRDWVPSLANAPIAASHLCLYCDTPDGDLWVDRHPEQPDLLVAAGGSGHGFKFAPVLGDQLLRLAVGGDPWGRTRWRTESRGLEASRQRPDGET